MKAQTDRFRVSSHMQDRIKLPGVFWAGLKSIGLTPGAVLRLSNLPPTVYSGESLVTTAQNFSIWRAIRELSNDPTIGWKFMSQVETDQYHPTLLAALHARTSANPSRGWHATNSFAVPRNFGSPKKAMRFLSRSPGLLPGTNRRLRY